MKPVEALLAVAAHPELAPMSFNFWHRLARALTSSFAAPGGGAAPEGRAAAAQVSHCRHLSLCLAPLTRLQCMEQCCYNLSPVCGFTAAKCMHSVRTVL